MPSTVYECPECGDRKLVDHSRNGARPTLWCTGWREGDEDDEGHTFVAMEKKEDVGG